MSIQCWPNNRSMLFCGLGRPVITSETGNWYVFQSLGWCFVFEIIMKWDGREPHIVRCHHGSGGIHKAVSLLRLSSEKKWVAPRTSLIGRPSRGYSVSPPCHLTNACRVIKDCLVTFCRAREKTAVLHTRAALDNIRSHESTIVYVILIRSIVFVFCFLP